jgi:hypothetical protein
VQSTILEPDNEDEELHEVLEVLRREAKFQGRWENTMSMVVEVRKEEGDLYHGAQDPYHDCDRSPLKK